jgi:hypothetical protein
MNTNKSLRDNFAVALPSEQTYTQLNLVLFSKLFLSIGNAIKNTIIQSTI